MLKRHERWMRAGLLTVLILALAGCFSKDPVTGRTTLNFLSEEQEIALGKQSHEAVVETFGIYEDKEWNDYVSGIGQEIAAISHRSHLDYRFYVVDSPVVNAFALPGGYVYFTRGILAHFNSQDELAGVMGHEIGHVVARHSAEQYSRQQLAGIGFTVAMMASEDFREYADLASLGLGLLFLKFSRNQESESDKLGVEYTTRLGYDSHKMAGFFNTISRLQGESGGLPTFLSTHPNPLAREERVHELTEQYRQELEFKPRNLVADNYLRRIDGLVYGEDPRNGYVENGMLYHPRWNVQMAVPQDWQMQRQGSQFMFVHPNQEGALLLQKVKEARSPEDAAKEFIEKTGADVRNRDRVRLNGFAAELVYSYVGEGESELAVQSYFIGNGADLFVGHGLAEPDRISGLSDQFKRTLGRFSTLTNASARAVKPERVRVKRAPRNDSLEANLRALGVGDNDKLQELSVLNGMSLEEKVARGKLLKVVGK